MAPDELLDVDAVDRRAPLEPPVRVDRRRAAEVAEGRRATAAPVDVGGAERPEPRPDEPAGRSGARSAGDLRQGRDHRASWSPLSRPRRRRVASWWSRPTSTTACSRSERRSPRGAGQERRSSSSPCSPAIRTRPLAAGGWDRRGGFATEGESARARREEDRRACAVLGATPVWLPVRERRLRAPRRRRGRASRRVGRGRRGERRPPPGLSPQPSRPRMARADARAGAGRSTAPRSTPSSPTPGAPGSNRTSRTGSPTRSGGGRSSRSQRGCATASRSGGRSGATARSSRCSGCAGACGAARSATPSLPSGSPGAPD